ncbi:MAG: rhomboid family intramembrane serine protease [archaeon]
MEKIEIKKKNIIIFIVSIIVLISIFVIFSNAINFLTFSGESFFNGELWRILTFSFVHISEIHLIENIIAIFILNMIILQLNLKFKEIIYPLVGGVIILPLIEGIFFPTIVIAGASLAIYSLFGSLTFKFKNNLIKIGYLSLFLFIFAMDIIYTYLNNLGIENSILHPLAFILGIIISLILIWKEN